MTAKKRRFNSVSSVRWLPDGSGGFNPFDPEASVATIVDVLNGELLLDGEPDETERREWKQQTGYVLGLLKAGIAGIAAFRAEEGRLYVSPDYPDPDDLTGPLWLDAMEEAQRAEFANLRALDELNGLLSQYQVTLSLEPAVTSDGEGVGWRFGEEFEHRHKEQGLHSYILGWLVELARLGLLNRIRQCECGRWFYAERGNQRSHTPLCRKNKYEENSRDKTRRTHYMRWYYAMYQSPKAPRKKLSFEQWRKKQQMRLRDDAGKAK